MPIIDRLSATQARTVFEKLIPNNSIRESVIEFFAVAIEFAHSINDSNWNLNLDKNGQFVRFNTGQEYCIEVNSKETLILCNRIILRDFVRNRELPIVFRGHRRKERIHSKNIDEVPDCLSKTPESVGCVIENNLVVDLLGLLEAANHEFINYSIQETSLLAQSKTAHSTGCIKYFSEITGRHIPNPNYKITDTEFYRKQRDGYLKAKKLSTEELEKRIKNAKPNAEKVYVLTVRYNRNPYLAEYVKRRANGICQVCKQPAPFYSKQFGEPFLESHHINPLANGGSDTLDNLIALCPNCHREKHYG